MNGVDPDPKLSTLAGNDTADGQSRLVPFANLNLCLDVAPDGAHLVLVPCSDAKTQKSVGLVDQDGTMLVQHTADLRCLDDAADKDGRPVLMTCTPSRPNQHFKVVKVTQ